MDLNRDLGPIGSNVHVVFQSFRTLFNTESQSNAEDLSTFEDESTRFKMWVGNLGAHQSGRASLDYRLREALHLQEQVVYLLKDISDSLQDAVSLARPEPPSWQKSREGQNLQTDMTTSSAESLNDESSEDLSDFDENEPPGTSLSTQCADVGEAIDCLLRLSIAIANPAPHERFRKLGGGASEDVSYYETHDIGYVQDKYPDIKPELAEMLGKTITRRRQFFKYREAHHQKLAAGLDMALHGQEGDTSHTEVISKTVASSLPDHLKGRAEIEAIPDFIDEDGQSEMGMSQTSYATSAGVLTGEIEEDELTKKPPPVLKVPPLPAAAARGAFECPFCYRMVSASTRAAWKRHVFGDLRPYTCPLTGCTGSSMGFERRHQWKLHVSQQHWQSWFCSFQCQETFDSQEALKYHLSREHLQTATEEHLSAISALAKRPASESLTKECPLCRHKTMGLKAFVKHVGRHLEQLALFALPSVDNYNQDTEIQSDQENVTDSQQDSDEKYENALEAPANIDTSTMTEYEVADFSNLIAKVLKIDYEFAWNDSQRFFTLHDKAVLSHGAEAIENTPEEISAAAAKLLQILQGIRSSTPSTNLDSSSSLVMPRQKDMEAARTGEAGNNRQGAAKLDLPGPDWKRLSDDEHIQTTARGWARYIKNHFPLSNPRILLENRRLRSYVVETDEGFFLFFENLRQAKLVSKTIGGAFENLHHSPPICEGVNTLEAVESPRLSVPQVHMEWLGGGPGLQTGVVGVTGEVGRGAIVNQPVLGASFDDEWIDYERVEAQRIDLLKRVDLEIPEHELTRESKSKDPEIKSPQDLPIRFKDALGRKFSFPYHVCRSWRGMEELIKQAFAAVDTIGPLVMEGYYDIIGPDGDIILPSAWHKTIQPGWSITMSMWPMEYKPPVAPTASLTSRGKSKLKKGDAQTGVSKGEAFSGAFSFMAKKQSRRPRDDASGSKSPNYSIP